MEFLTDEVITANNFTEEQVSAIKQLGGNYVADLKKAWDTKANDNAEGILSGAVKYVTDKTGVKLEREQGEKYGDFLQRLSDASLANAKTALEQKEQELQAKLKDFKGGDEYKSLIDTLKQEKDTLLKQVAELEPLKGYDEKYNQAQEELTGFKKEVAYSKVKPNFPESVNTFEADAKWNALIKEIESKNTIELVDGEAIAVDKENKHKTYKLKDLVDQNETIKELLTGRQQGGTGAKPTGEQVTIEGVPFPVKKGATSSERTQAIREYLAKEGVGSMDSKYPALFKQYNDKILNA